MEVNEVMRKNILLFAVLVLCSVLSSCGTVEPEVPTTVDTTTAVTTEAKSVTEKSTSNPETTILPLETTTEVTIEVTTAEPEPTDYNWDNISYVMLSLNPYTFGEQSYTYTITEPETISKLISFFRPESLTYAEGMYLRDYMLEMKFENGYSVKLAYEFWDENKKIHPYFRIVTFSGDEEAYTILNGGDDYLSQLLVSIEEPDFAALRSE